MLRGHITLGVYLQRIHAVLKRISTFEIQFDQ
jgi:hypothetical protein